MKGYCISLYTKIDSQENLKKYAETVTPIIKSFGGIPLVRGGKHECFDGDNFLRTVVWEFPNYEKAPLALFYQGFVLENYMGQLQQAKSVYESFLTSYPKHELSETVRLSIQQLGVPLEDLVKQFENKN